MTANAPFEPFIYASVAEHHRALRETVSRARRPRGAARRRRSAPSPWRGGVLARLRHPRVGKRV